MAEPNLAVQQVTLSSQAFLLLCRLFDRCYDELKQDDHMTEWIESIAHILLVELLAHAPEQEEKTAAWWQECLMALTGEGGGDGPTLT